MSIASQSTDKSIGMDNRNGVGKDIHSGISRDGIGNNSGNSIGEGRGHRKVQDDGEIKEKTMAPADGGAGWAGIDEYIERHIGNIAALVVFLPSSIPSTIGTFTSSLALPFSVF